MRPWRVLLAAAALAGCAHVTPVAETDGLDFRERQMRLTALDGWEMRGRLAVDTGERAFQARFRWRQDADSMLLAVNGPFGAGSFQIDGTDEEMTVRARGERWTLSDPETDLSALFGWWLPVGSLKDWLIGLPDTLYDARTRFSRGGTLASLEQRLWDVEYPEYRLSDGLLVPRKIDMSHGRLELRLTVDSWDSLAPTANALN
jgi:outer membrane lipoprotein LolB